MNCPNCGADTKNAVTICPLCGTTLDRMSAYNSYLKKGDDFSASGEIDKAVMSYNKALEYSAGDEDIYLKLGNAYNKNNDKKAATAYMKALTFNFYNDKTHNMLIALYSKYGRLADLKKWYEQSRGKADASFVDKYVKIIENVDYFSKNSESKIPASKNKGLAETLISSMKRYVIMNIVVVIFVLVIALAIVAAIMFKVDTSFIVLFSGLRPFAQGSAFLDVLDHVERSGCTFCWPNAVGSAM